MTSFSQSCRKVNNIRHVPLFCKKKMMRVLFYTLKIQHLIREEALFIKQYCTMSCNNCTFTHYDALGLIFCQILGENIIIFFLVKVSGQKHPHATNLLYNWLPAKGSRHGLVALLTSTGPQTYLLFYMY